MDGWLKISRVWYYTCHRHPVVVFSLPIVQHLSVGQSLRFSFAQKCVRSFLVSRRSLSPQRRGSQKFTMKHHNSESSPRGISENSLLGIGKTFQLWKNRYSAQKRSHPMCKFKALDVTRIISRKKKRKKRAVRSKNKQYLRTYQVFFYSCMPGIYIYEQQYGHNATDKHTLRNPWHL